MKIHSDSYDPQGQTARQMVKLAALAFDFVASSTQTKMLRQLLLKCTPFEFCHQGAYETKSGKKVDLVMTESSCSEIPVTKRVKTKTKTELKVYLGWERREVQEPVQNSFTGSKSALEGQMENARVMMRSQRLQGSKKGAPLAWLEGD